MIYTRWRKLLHISNENPEGAFIDSLFMFCRYPHLMSRGEWNEEYKEYSSVVVQFRYRVHIDL